MMPAVMHTGRRFVHKNFAGSVYKKFYGKYANVLAALERLATTDVTAVPVGIKMDKTNPDADGWRVWTLVLWL